MARRMSVHGDFLKEGDLQCKGALFMWHNRHYMLMEDGALHQLKCHLTASSAAVQRGELELSVTNCRMVDPEETSFVLKAKSQQERDSWFESFTMAIQAVQQRAGGSTAPATPQLADSYVAVPSPAHAAVTLENATVEELTEALKKKGVLATPPPQVDTRELSMVTKAVLESVTKFIRQDEHKRDQQRRFSGNLYLSLVQLDWDRQPAGYSCDAKYVIEIGPTEDHENTPMVLIKFYDTMQKYVPNSRYGDPMIPIYGIAFSAQEMRDLTANVVANAEILGTLIHREPQGDVEPDEPAYMEVHWLVEAGKISGIRAVIKPSQRIASLNNVQDAAPTMELLRWKMRGDRFEIQGQNEMVHPRRGKSGSGFEVVLPEPAFEGVKVEYGKGAYCMEQVKTALHFDSEGESVIQLTYATSSEWDDKQAMYGWSRFRSGRHWNEDGFLRQRVTSPCFTILNPSDSNIQIAEYWIEISVEGQFVRAKKNQIGVSGYRGDVNWLEDQSTVPLENHVGFDVYFRGYHEVVATDDPSLVLCEHIDAMDSGGSWYQAFVIFRSDSKIRVHFNGWSSNYDEDILSDSIAVRTRPRNADTPTGSSGNETDDAVRAAVASSLLKYNMRELSSDARCLHPYYDQPLRCRLVIKDDSGKTRSIDWELCNDNRPAFAARTGVLLMLFTETLGNLWTDFADAKKAMGDLDEFSTHRSDMFMCYENPITLNKLFLSVTSSESKPDKYVVRMSNDTRKVPGNTSYCYLESLRRIGYTAKKTGRREVDPELGSVVPSDPSDGSCILTALVDEHGEVYAFRGEIILTHNGKTLLKATRHMAIDYERFDC